MTPPNAPRTPPAHRRAIEAALATPAPTIERDVGGVELRLAIGKDGLGLELVRPARLGCADVVDLAVRLPGARFPIDVSGGVDRFRHKRGALERLTVEVGARALEPWLAPRLRGLLGPRTPHVWIAVRRTGATVCVSDPPATSTPSPEAGPRILVFELVLGARDADLVAVVVRARGARLPRPATALAVAAVDAVLGPLAARSGTSFTLRDVAGRAAKVLLPDAGARAPSADGVTIGAIAAHDDTWIVHTSRDATPPVSTREWARAAEAAALTRDADEARLAGLLERARVLDLGALGRAPRHPEICRRIAEIDAHVGGRAEAALLTLREAERDPDGAASTLLTAELLAETRDERGAIAAFARAGEEEEAPLLAAHAYARAAELSPDPLEALGWLDLAISRAPDAPYLRAARIARRLAAGRLEEAIGDVEHLEALAASARDKFDVWRLAGDAWKRAGLVAEATTLYERALRYAPDDPGALAGLGAALAADGHAGRGAALIARAIDLAEAAGASGSPDATSVNVAAMRLDLARALAEALADRPAAIARVRAIPNDAPEAMIARGLEGRWRAAVGDLAGASLAFARLRDLAGASLPREDTTGARASRTGAFLASELVAAMVALLVEAAEFEESAQRDLLAAQRHLACALRLAPRDASVERAYRAVGLRIAGRAPAEAGAAPLAASPTPPAVVPSGSDNGSDDEARVEELTRALQANPEDEAVVDELAVRLTRLGRSLELFALLSGRLEDAPPERRARLVPQQRAVLERLERDARAAGRTEEAALFASALLGL